MLFVPSHQPGEPQAQARTMALAAAALFAGASILGVVEQLISGGPETSPAAAAIAIVMTLALLVVGPRIPARWLTPLGIIGTLAVGVALWDSGGRGDGAVLYFGPVLWSALFLSRSGVIATLVAVAIVQGAVVNHFPPGYSSVDRWLDVVVSMTIVAGVITVLRVRTDLLLKQLASEAVSDPLTGLLNRRGLDDRMASEVARARREGHPLAVITFDIDHFKAVNDEFGHAHGDVVLARLGEILLEEKRRSDIAARVGGEEFTVVLPGAREGQAFEFAERVRAAVAHDARPAVTVSAGVAVGEEDFPALTAAADAALYRAKRAGRDRTVVSDHAMAHGDDPEQTSSAAEPALKRG